MTYAAGRKARLATPYQHPERSDPTALIPATVDGTIWCVSLGTNTPTAWKVHDCETRREDFLSMSKNMLGQEIPIWVGELGALYAGNAEPNTVRGFWPAVDSE